MMELAERVDALEKLVASIARKALGQTITEVKIGNLYRCLPGERIKTGGYIRQIEHKVGNKGPWQSFKLVSSDEKGVYVKHFSEWPEWASEGTCCVVDELSVDVWNGKNTYAIRKWGPYVSPNAPKGALPTREQQEAAMKYNAPLPSIGDADEPF